MNELKTKTQLPQTIASSSLSFEEYYKQQIAEGYITENGTPLECSCGLNK